MISVKTRADMTNLVINVILPCNIFMAFQQGVTPQVLMHSLIVLVCAFGLQFLAFLVNKVAFIKIHEKKALILKYTTITNNAGFMGLPIIGAVLGDVGVLYGAIFLIPMRIMMWTSGLSLFTSLESKNKVKSLITHPCMIAVFLGFAYVFVPVSLPVFMSDTVRWVGEVTRVMPMIIVGSILSEVKFREVLDKHAFYFSFIRLILMPAIMLAVLWRFELDPIVIAVSVLMAAMPSAIVTAMLAEKYSQDTAFATKTVFVTTVLSLITLPIISMVLEWLMPALHA